ncbi:MAG: hypothetical protein ACYC35_04895 [Pirellulales bacterium]
MPSYRVANEIILLGLFDVVGKDGGELAFVGHVGLASAAGLQNAAKISVLDVGPPLHGQDSPGHMRADVVGSAVLTDDDVQKVRTFVDRHANEHRLFLQFSKTELMTAVPEMYCVLPHAKPFDEEDGRYARMCFSCAGFVLEAYKKARIELLDPSALPPVDIADIRLCYPMEIRLIDDGRVRREDLGLAGEGSWAVLLCGYLLHALNRDAETIRREPYVPASADRHFH